MLSGTPSEPDPSAAPSPDRTRPDATPIDRRHLLRWLSVGGAILVTGCGGSDASSSAGVSVVTEGRRTQIPPAAPASTPVVAATAPIVTFARGVGFTGLEGSPDTLPGHLNGEVFVTPDSHFAYYAGKGCDHIRVEAVWERLQPRLYGTLGEQLLDHYADANNPLRNPVALVGHYLDVAASHGLKVILDLCHNYGSRYVGYDGSWANKYKAQLGSAQLPVWAWVDYCAKVAQVFGNHPAVAAIELMNEPHDLPIGSQGWAGACQSAITAIRAVNTRVAIMVDGYNWASAQVWPNVNPTLHTLADPANRIIWSAHQYFDRDSSGTYAGGSEAAPADKNVGVTRLAPFIAWLAQHGFTNQGHIGEFGAPNRTDWQPVVQNFVRSAKAAGLALTAHEDMPYPNDPYVMNLFPTTNGAGAIIGPDRFTVQALLS